MTSKWKTTLWVLVGIVAVPFTCCGSGYLVLFFHAPVTWEYEPNSLVSEFQDHEFVVFIRGKNDYYLDQSGARSVKLNAYRMSTNSETVVRILNVQVHGSLSGEVIGFDAGSLPEVFEFEERTPYKHSLYDQMAHWSGRDFNIEPKSQEIINVIIQVEIIKPGSDPELHEFKAQFNPKRIHRPIGYHMPHA